MLSLRSLILPLSLVFGLSLVACDGGEEDGDDDAGEEGGNCNADQTARVDTVLALTPDEANGATVFANTCGIGSCHGADGNSGTGPALSDEIPDYSSDALGCLLLTGVGTMPSQAGLSDQDLADVIAYAEATF
ncbi:MAG: cytochrome c [Myxococcales bacterium]|nr:cytochrome c [Myxococcales bacterium]MCA9699258.1 cytochrome c [Myxococcales bacterium]